MTKIMVTYSSNNSGGSWWLSDKNWQDLHDAGWQLKRDYMQCRYSSDGNPTPEDEEWNWSLNPHEASDKHRFLGAITTTARKEFGSMREAVEEWEAVTGQDASDEGCNCCGQPHSFSGVDENGKYVDGPKVKVTTTLDWG